jgi:hypothetical protein
MQWKCHLCECNKGDYASSEALRPIDILKQPDRQRLGGETKHGSMPCADADTPKFRGSETGHAAFTLACYARWQECEGGVWRQVTRDRAA